MKVRHTGIHKFLMLLFSKTRKNNLLPKETFLCVNACTRWSPGTEAYKLNTDREECNESVLDPGEGLIGARGSVLLPGKAKV